MESADGKNPLNIAKWFNFITFDIIGNLAFRESFGCLNNKKFHT